MGVVSGVNYHNFRVFFITLKRKTHSFAIILNPPSPPLKFLMLMTPRIFCSPLLLWLSRKLFSFFHIFPTVALLHLFCHQLDLHILQDSILDSILSSFCLWMILFIFMISMTLKFLFPYLIPADHYQSVSTSCWLLSLL